ncbi:Membrane protein insertase YidC [Pirellulimonas nuda]|uniref:Membrane protein insertase YidC n=1 Tax=Pirellulimonas nuda TaxID=2528009 RepID=A0A518DEP0_9BACT|nr:membrane protein insertase YidC [Pirellulimonas nuda]QDU89938.1 Membrane protein insertase YidC [Pirellulimonas nuda]
MTRISPQSKEQPFDQRLLTFVLLSAAVVMLWSQSMAPKPPVEPKDKPAADAVARQDDELDEEGSDAADGEAADPDKPDAEAPLVEDQPAVDPARVTFGSLASDGPYRMLVSANNIGGAIERIELSSEQYRDLHDRAGYLGSLELSETMTVRQVGAGTPAALAGIEVGDTLASVAGKTVDSPQAVAKALAETKPGDTLKVGVRRGDADKQLEVKLERRPLDVIRPELENILLFADKPPADFRPTPSFLLRLESVGDRGTDSTAIRAANRQLTREAWKVESTTDASVTFTMRLAKLGLDVVKRFTLVEVPEAQRSDPLTPAYHFVLGVEVRNLLDAPQKVAYRLEGPNGLPIEGWWFSNKIGQGWGQYGIRDVVARLAGNQVVQQRASSIAEGDGEVMEGAPVAFAGVDAQYFAVVMLPEKETLEQVWFDKVEPVLATPLLEAGPKDGWNKPAATWNNPTISLVHEPVELAAAGAEGDTLSEGFKVFAGPKRPDLLAKYYAADQPAYNLQGILQYGWFGPVAKVMLAILHVFNSVVGNYGVAIIMLTVLVRGIMFPLSRKQAQNMVLMQTLKPEMDRIAEKYKTDMDKRAKAQQELFRKHKYNPMGGCLPMFIQLPIFLGLYRALAVDVELRQAPLFTESIRFCSNLAAPDMFYDWSAMVPRWFQNGQGIFALGPYFNLLPILTICLFLLQQKMFMPPAANEQAAMQQKMMKYMMVFFGLMFFKVPSGLCLYFIASSLWGIAERKLLPKPALPADAAPVMSKPTSVSPNRNGSSGAARNAKKKKRR